MHVFWHTILRPILQALRPRTIVEIGVEHGHTTQHLLAFCRETGATLHGIDPLPLIDEAQWQNEWGATWTLHRGNSLDVLPTLPPFDAVLIDGNHNWYTVLHELRSIDRHAQRHRCAPVMLLHDIDAPYGRRDLYYDPETIPPDMRRPWQRRGIDTQRGTLTEHGGLNPGLCHAIHEGGPRNGVRTAVEDFLQETEQRYAWYEVHGFHGLGIAVPRTLLDGVPALQKLVTELSTSALLQNHIMELEHDRIIRMMHHQTLQNALYASTQDLRRMTEETTRLSRDLATTDATLRHMVQTRSWRWTAWIRKVGSWMKRQKM